MALYLLHFSEPLGDPTRPRMSARHYLGFAVDDRSRVRRIEHHRRGTAGVAITAAAVAQGIELLVGWVGAGDRNEERRLKRNGNHHRRCKICRQQASEDLMRSPEMPCTLVP